MHAWGLPCCPGPWPCCTAAVQAGDDGNSLAVCLLRPNMENGGCQKEKETFTDSEQGLTGRKIRERQQRWLSEELFSTHAGMGMCHKKRVCRHFRDRALNSLTNVFIWINQATFLCPGLSCCMVLILISSWTQCAFGLPKSPFTCDWWTDKAVCPPPCGTRHSSQMLPPAPVRALQASLYALGPALSSSPSQWLGFQKEI